MKKIKAGFRRTICILLAAVSLSMSVTSSYYGATTAYAAEAGITLELLELLLASLGVSCTTSEQLKQVKARVDGCNPTYGWSEEEYLAYQEMNSLTAGDILDLGKEGFSNTWKKLKSKVSNVIVDVNRAKIDFTHPVDLGTIGNVKVVRGSVTSDEIMSLFGGVPVKPNNNSANFYYEGASPCLTSGFVLIGKQTIDDYGSRRQPLAYMSEGMCTSISKNRGYYYLQCDEDSLSVRSIGTDAEYSCIYIDIVGKTLDSTYYTCQGYTKIDDKYYLGGTNNYASYNPKSVYSLSNIFTDSSYDKDYTLYTTLPMYSSKEDYINSIDAKTSNPVNGFLYGASSAALAIGGAITLHKGGAITQEVSDAISALKAENPDATDDEINETVAGVLAGIGELDSSIEEGNDIAASSNSWLEKIHDKVSAGFDMSMSAIHAAIMALGTSVTSKLDDILAADYSAVIHGQMTDVLSGLHDIDAGLDSLAGDIGAVVGGALGEWTQTWENSFDLVLGGWTDTLDGIAEHIASLSFPDVIEGVLTGAVDVVWPDVITLDIPDILGKILEGLNSLSIPNYMSILQEILNAIQNIFGLDMVAIQVAALGLTGALDGCFPDLDKIRDIFAGFHFSDSSEYPVIKVQTPQIIKEHGYDKEYIILCDFSDYAVYCVWVRRLCRLMIWLAFAYTIFSHFKVRFSIT